MKYLKTFEELKPSTYISAGSKLSLKGQTSRGSELTDYGVSKIDQIQQSKNKKYEIFYKDKIYHTTLSFKNGFITFEIDPAEIKPVKNQVSMSKRAFTNLTKFLYSPRSKSLISNVDSGTKDAFLTNRKDAIEVFNCIKQLNMESPSINNLFIDKKDLLSKIKTETEVDTSVISPITPNPEKKSFKKKASDWLKEKGFNLD